MADKYEKWKRRQRLYFYLYLVANVVVFILSFLWGCRLFEAIAHIAK